MGRERISHITGAAWNLWKDNRYVFVGALAFLILLQIALAFTSARAIESAIYTRSSSLIEQNGYGRVVPYVSGRDVTLQGQVSSEEAVSAVSDLISFVDGVRMVYADLRINPLRLPHLSLARSTDNLLVIDGELPTSGLAEKLARIASNAVSHDGMPSNGILIDPEVAVPPWISAVQGIAQEGDRLDGMEILLGAGTVSLGGMVDSLGDYEFIITRLEQFAAEYQLNLVNRIGIRPANAAMDSDAGKSSDTELAGLDEPSGVRSSVPVQVEEADSGPLVETESTHSEPSESVLAGGMKSLPDSDHTGPGMESCQQLLEEALERHPLIFAPNVADITVENYTSIEKMANILNKCPTFNANLEGYTDSRGNSEANRRLSGKRAESVLESLVLAGVDRERVQAVGYGDANPVASNETAEGRKRNRRIEVRLAKAEPL